MGFTRISNKTVFEQQKEELAKVYPSVLAECVKSARRNGLNEDDARELVNTAARKALTSMSEKGVCEGHNPEAFMKFIYKRLVINFQKYKKNGISSFLDKDGYEVDIFEHLASEQAHPLKSYVMSKLYGLMDEVLREESLKVQAYWQDYLEGYKYREIAKRHDSVTNTVGSDLHRVKKKVLAKFKAHGFDQETLSMFDESSMSQGAQDDE